MTTERPAIEAVSLDILFPVFSNPGDMSLFYSLAKARPGRFQRHSSSKAVMVHALRGVSVRIGEGERVGIVGRNGSGKSTLLRTIGGYLRPYRGSLRVSGTVGTLIDLGIGINGDRSAFENVQFTGRLIGLNKSELRAFQEDVANFSDIGAFYQLPFDTYSSGMKLRVMFAMVTHFKRDILAIDEIFGVGDVHFADRAYKRMVDIVDSSRTLVLATHSEALLRTFCTRCIWMDNGIVAADGSVDEVMKAYAATA